MKKSQLFMMAFALLLSACAVGPDYERPSVEVPAAYKEQQGIWKPATPQDTIDRGAWWAIYNDPVLDGLEKQVAISNQNLKAAEAAYRQAHALAEVARAGLFPTVTGDASATRSKAAGKVQNHFSIAANATWELDVWGRIRRQVESAEAEAEATAADLASARLSAQAELAVDYFDLRAQDEIKRFLDETVTAYQETYKIVKNQYDAGVVAKTDLMQAETQLKSTQAAAINLGVARAQFEHAIAVLIGKPPGDFTLAQTPFLTAIPQIPADVPSVLLERRPDIAAAERRVAEANANVGAAIGAFFPAITLNASFGFASTALSTLFSVANSVWSIGPAASMNLFNMGLVPALEASRAAYDQSVANYRQTVLTAFQGVEDQLASQRILAQEADAQAATVRAAQEAEKLVLNQYKAGVVPYTNVVVAEAASLSAQQNALGIRRDRLVASANLITALGGGWNAAQIPAEASAAIAAKDAPSPANFDPNAPNAAPAPGKDSDSPFSGMGIFGL